MPPRWGGNSPPFEKRPFGRPQADRPGVVFAGPGPHIRNCIFRLRNCMLSKLTIIENGQLQPLKSCNMPNFTVVKAIFGHKYHKNR